MVIDGILIGVLGNAAYDILKIIYKNVFGHENEPLFNKIYNVIDISSASFFKKFEKKYGAPSESFLARQANINLLMNFMHYGSKVDLKKSLNRAGFGNVPDLSDDDIDFFINELKNEISKDYELDKVLTIKEFMSEQASGLQTLLDGFGEFKADYSKDKTEKIGTKLLYNYLQPIYFNHKFIEENQVVIDNPVVPTFYNINDDMKIIAKIVCSDLDVKNNSLLDLLNTQISSTQNEPLFILGNGGVGKTTALFRIAVENANYRPAFFIRLRNEQVSAEKILESLDHIDMIAKQKNVSALLIIDNPYVNMEFVRILHNRLSANDMSIKPILVERLSRMDMLMNDRNYNLYDWYDNANIVLISTKNKISTDKMKWIHPEKTCDYVIDKAWNKDVLSKMIEFILLKENINQDILYQSYQKIICDNKNDKLSVSEQRYSIIYEYNKSVKDNKIKSYATISLDWDEWDRLFEQRFGHPCANTFVYLAALYLFKIPMRIEMLASITDIPVNQLQTFLDMNLNKGINEPVQFINDIIYLKHDIIADLFFDFFHDKYSAQTYLKRIINSKMDDDTVIEFEKVVFSKKYINGDRKAPFDVDPCKLLLEFGKNKKYLDLLKSKERLYSYDLAVAWSKKGDDRQIEFKRLLDKYQGHFKVNMAFLKEQEDIRYSADLIKELPMPIVNKENITEVDNYGRLLHRLGNRDVAAELFRSIININPDDIPSRMALGAIYKENHEFEKAEEIYLYILEHINNDNLPTLSALGILYTSMKGREVDAIKMFEKALHIDCNNIQTLNAYGKFMRRVIKNDDDAEKLFLRCLEINNSHIQSINELGMLYESQNKYKKAIDMYELALGIKRRNIPTLNVYGNLLFRQKNYEKAAEMYEAALKIDENEYHALYGLALISIMKGTREESIKRFTELHRKYPREVDPLTHLGSLYMYEDENAALGFFNMALKINKKNPYALEKVEEIMQSVHINNIRNNAFEENNEKKGQCFSDDNRIKDILNKIFSGKVITDKEINYLCPYMLQKLESDNSVEVSKIIRLLDNDLKQNNLNVINVRLELARNENNIKDMQKLFKRRGELLFKSYRNHSL